jgi:hypothetical protein
LLTIYELPCEGHQEDLEDLEGLEDLEDLEAMADRGWQWQPQLFQQEEIHLQQTPMTG